MITKPSLQKTLQGILHTKHESKPNHMREWEESKHKRRKHKESESNIDLAIQSNP
jgi:heme-degrading monooxygenase HmoA